MSFRVSVTQLRVLLVVGNLLLAVAVFGTASWNMIQPREPENPVKVKSASEFAFREVPTENRTPASSRVKESAAQLQPSPPAEVVEGPGDAAEDPEVGDEEEPPPPVEGGPLEGNWEYVYYMIDRSNPLKSLVKLQKAGGDKKGPTRAAGRRGRATTRAARRTSRTAGRRGARGKKGAAQDSVAFLVGDRKFKVPDSEEVFYVETIDQGQFVYWAYEEGPETMYSLAFKESTPYGEDPEKGIRPEDEEDEDEKGEDEEEPQKFFIVRQFDYERDFEEEYRAVKSGETKIEEATLINEDKQPAFSGKKPPTPAPKAPAKSAKRGTNFKRPGKVPPAGGDPATGSALKKPSKPMTKEEGFKEIGGILEQAEKDGKLSDEDKEEVKKLQQMLAPPKKKNRYVETPGE